MATLHGAHWVSRRYFWPTLSGLVRAGQAGPAARLFGGIALWVYIGFAVMAVCAFRSDLSDLANQVLTELEQLTTRVPVTLMHC